MTKNERLRGIEAFKTLKMEHAFMNTKLFIYQQKACGVRVDQWEHYKPQVTELIHDSFESSQRDEQRLCSRFKAYQRAFPHFVPPSFGTKTMEEATKSGSVNESQRSDQDAETQMEIDSGQPSKVHEIGTGTDPVTRTETETDPVTKTLEVEEVVSFIEPTPPALESVSPAPQQVLNDQGVTNMVE